MGSLDTTQIYTQVAINDLKRLHTALHPAAGMSGRTGAPGDGGHATLIPEDLLATLETKAGDEEADT